jgi:hypothetical protein
MRELTVVGIAQHTLITWTLAVFSGENIRILLDNRQIILILGDTGLDALALILK